MLNLNTNNDYSMAFTHHHITTTNEQQFYHNLYSNVSTTTPTSSSLNNVIKEKNDGNFKNPKVDFINNLNSEFSPALIKDGENSKRFSVNNLLKPPTTSPSCEKYNGKKEIKKLTKVNYCNSIN